MWFYIVTANSTKALDGHGHKNDTYQGWDQDKLGFSAVSQASIVQVAPCVYKSKTVAICENLITKAYDENGQHCHKMFSLCIARIHIDISLHTYLL